MRSIVVMVLILAACAPGDNQATDTAAMVDASDALTAEDISGSWSGTTFAEGSDSVLVRWTSTMSGSSSVLLFEGSTDSVRARTSLDADSVIVESDPYPAATLPGNPQVRFRSVGRLRDGNLVGTSVLMLASEPDSVVRRTRWEATRTSP